MSILSVDQISPIGSGTTITLNATEIKTGNEITIGTGSSIFSPAGNTLTFGTNSTERLRITNAGAFGLSGTNYGSSGQVLTSQGSGSAPVWSTIPAQATIANNADNRVITGGSGVNLNGEANVQIDSSGRLMIGTTTAGYNDLDDLTIATSGNTGITIRSGTSSLGVIGFADGTSGNTQYRGVIQYRHSSDAMEFNTADAQRMRILGDGRVLINTSDGAAFSSRKLSVADVSSGGTTAIEIRSATNGSGRLYFTDSTSSGDAGSYAGKVFYDHNTDYMGFYTGGGTNTPGERMKIDAYGRVTTPNQPSFHVVRTAGDVSGNNYVIFNRVDHNNGGHYNSSNGRFTAPVTGVYFFSCYHFTGGSPHSAIRLNINGSQFGAYHWDDTGGCATWVAPMTAGQYAQIYTVSYTFRGTSDYHNGFNGFLIG